MIFGEVRIVEDVPGEFSALVTEQILLAAHEATRDGDVHPFRLGCSGSSSGRQCYTALAGHDEIPWDHLACYFADERCVEPGSPDANATMLRETLSSHIADLAGFFPMSCTDGPAEYEGLLRTIGPLDLLQLGVGPDGHTASLFPGSTGLVAPAARLVVRNVDPRERNPFDRLTLTFSAISSARLVVFTVIGAEKRDAMGKIAAGIDLPAGRVRADRVIWLCEPDAVEGLQL